MRNNIVFLFAPGPFGGAENIVLRGANLLGVPIWLIRERRAPSHCERFVEECARRRIPTKVFECSSRFDFATLRLLKQCAKKERVKFIQSHGIKANLYCALLPVKRIGTQHGKTSHDIKVKFFEYIEDFCLRRSDAIVCVSKDMVRSYPPGKTHLVENFLPDPARKKRYSNAGKLRLLFVGRASREKGLAELIEAMGDMKDTELTVLGTGPELNRLKEKAIGLANIKFEGFQRNVAPYYENADALIMPSHREGLPLGAIEAAAAGLPVLASSVGDLPLIVKENGVLFRPGCPEDIKSAIIKFRNNRASYNQAAARRAHLIKRRYSPETWRSKTNLVYKSLS